MTPVPIQPTRVLPGSDFANGISVICPLSLFPGVEENLGVYGSREVGGWQTIVMNMSSGVQFFAGNERHDK
jgi:hypothetical protein